MRWLAVVQVLFSLVLLARGASASIVLAKADGDVRVGAARVAFSSTPARTMAWEQLSLTEVRGELAWVIAVPRGGWIEPADDHFFESLDEATAAVIAPAKSLQCGSASESTAEPRGTWVRAVSTAVAPLAPAAAIEKLVALGYVVDPGSRAAILSLEAIGEDVAILLMPAGPRGMTRTARVLGPATRAFPLTLAPGGRLTAYVFSHGRARLAGVSSVEIDPARLSWVSNRSNYQTLLDEAVDKRAVVTTFAGVEGVFADQPAGATTLPSLVRRYFTGGSPATAECVTRAASLGFSARVVTPTCAKSSSWTASLTPPGCAVASADEIPSSQLTCGALDDLSAALGGLSPGRAVLTRFDAVAAAASAGRAVELIALGSIPSFREAKLGPLCTSETQPPGMTQPPPSTHEPVPTTEQAEPAPSSSSSSNGCATTAQIVADGCSRSDGGGGCGGSSEGDDGCSGDSSDSADDGCGSSSGSSGSCKGASDSADDGCRAARRAPRLRFSAAVYLLIALAAIARRAGRRSRYDGSRESRWSTPKETTSRDARATE